MKKISLFLILATSVCILLFGFNNCGVNQGFQAGNPDAPLMSNSLTAIENSNVMTIDAGGCGGYINEPCVSVKICVPGTNNCQTIDRLLLDTGSYGLRVFKSKVNLNLPDVTDASQRTYAECIEYLDGSAQWGPVKKADVVLGGLKASQVSIQIVDSTYATVPANCGESSNSLDISPEEEGFNGILGVGLFSEDCGAGCATSATNGLYFSCSGLICTGATISISQQVTNPVSLLPSDNNGVIVDLPAISANGAVQVFGSLILGIDTRENNRSSSMTFFQADSYGEMLTTFNGRSTYAFIDSGSNALFFSPTSTIPVCTNSGLTSFFCPTSLTNQTATLMGAAGTPSRQINFQVANAVTVFDNSNPNWIFNNLAGEYNDGFDWGLPFFFGRRIGFGIENKNSNLGKGPYFAF